MTTNVARICNALSFISPLDRDVWVRMGMALKSALGESAFDIWNEWSQQADSHDQSDAKDVWKSIRPYGGISAGTLFHEAKANGWHEQSVCPKPPFENSAEHMRPAVGSNAKQAVTHVTEQTTTARNAAAIWRESTECIENPYLECKRVSTVASLREIDATAAAKIIGYAPKSGDELLTGRLLVVPVKQGSKLSTVELIDGSRRKAALAGRGTKKAGFWAAQPLPDDDGPEPLQIFEGVGTALSGKEANSAYTIAALSASNLLTLAKVMRQRYPTKPIIIGADLVKRTGEPDPHAIEAALACNGKLAIPDFGAQREFDMTDFNDMAQACGLEAVAKALAQAEVPEIKTGGPSEESEPLINYASDVCLIRASDLTPEPIAWLWPNWLAAGKLHILGGAPGTGKTTICMALAATVTTGGCWPDGSYAPAGNVVIWSGEDDPADTLVPRLELSGADMSRIYFITDIREAKERRSFDPARDMEPLHRRLTEIGNVKLLIVDPIVSAIAGDSHKNAEVRRGLQPLVDLAGSLRCALLGITHFSKGTGGRDPVERLTGSLAFGALARVVLVAAKHQDEGYNGQSIRLFCRAKSNIGPDDGGFEYDLHHAELEKYPGIFASCVLWGKRVDGAARDLLATADATGDDGEGGTLTDAKHFLTDLLDDGPMSAKAIQADATGAGYSLATIRRAKKTLGIEAVKEGMKGGWAWRLPAPPIAITSTKTPKMLIVVEDAQQNKMNPFRAIEHLHTDKQPVKQDDPAQSKSVAEISIASEQTKK